MPVRAMDEAPQFVAHSKDRGPFLQRPRLSRIAPPCKKTAGVRTEPITQDRGREDGHRDDVSDCRFSLPMLHTGCSPAANFADVDSSSAQELADEGSLDRHLVLRVEAPQNALRHRQNAGALVKTMAEPASRIVAQAHGRAPRMTNPSFSKIEAASGPLKKSRNALASGFASRVSAAG